MKCTAKSLVVALVCLALPADAVDLVSGATAKFKNKAGTSADKLIVKFVKEAGIAAVLPDPTTSASSVRLRTDTQDLGPVILNPTLWKPAGSGYVYKDTAGSVAGIQKALFKPGGPGGKFLLKLKGDNYGAVALSGPIAFLEVTLTVGATSYCGRFEAPPSVEKKNLPEQVAFKGPSTACVAAAPTNSPTGADTATPNASPTSTPTNTDTIPADTPTATASATDTETPTATATATPSSTPTATATATPSSTATRTATPSSTATATPSSTSTRTATPSSTSTSTSTATSTRTPTVSPTPSSTPMCAAVNCLFAAEVMAGDGFDLGTPTLPFTSPLRNLPITPAGTDIAATCFPIGTMPPGSWQTAPNPPFPVCTTFSPCGTDWGHTTTPCSSVVSDGADHIYKLVVPAGVTSITVNTCSASTTLNNIISIIRCDGSNLGCSGQNDCPAGVAGADAAIGREIQNVPSVTPGETLFIVVASNQSTFGGDYVLTISTP